jgi:hypothetical protein
MACCEKINQFSPSERAVIGRTLAEELGVRSAGESPWSWQQRYDCILRFKAASTAERHRLMNRLSPWLPPLNGSFLRTAHLAEMADGGRCDFGSHTCSHVLMDQLSAKERRQELARSFQLLADIVPGFFPALAYPSGVADEALGAMARGTGYELAFTTSPGKIRPGSDPMMLPRIALHEDISSRVSLLACRLEGIPGFL